MGESPDRPDLNITNSLRHARHEVVAVSSSERSKNIEIIQEGVDLIFIMQAMVDQNRITADDLSNQSKIEDSNEDYKRLYLLARSLFIMDSDDDLDETQKETILAAKQAREYLFGKYSSNKDTIKPQRHTVGKDEERVAALVLLNGIHATAAHIFGIQTTLQTLTRHDSPDSARLIKIYEENLYYIEKYLENTSNKLLNGFVAEEILPTHPLLAAGISEGKLNKYSKLVDLPSDPTLIIDKESFKEPILFDPVLLSILYDNAAMNACKSASDANRPRAVIGVKQESDDDPSYVNIVISDNGMGIEGERYDFKKGESGFEQGNGVGMATLRELAQILDSGNDIYLRQNPNEDDELFSTQLVVRMRRPLN